MGTDSDKCVWCGRPEADHGPPGEQPIGGPDARLCPVPGVSSQFWTPWPPREEKAVNWEAEADRLRSVCHALEMENRRLREEFREAVAEEMEKTAMDGAEELAQLRNKAAGFDMLVEVLRSLDPHADEARPEVEALLDVIQQARGLRERVAALEGASLQAKALLADLEWSVWAVHQGTPVGRQCPECRAWKTGAVHHPGCRLAGYLVALDAVLAGKEGT